MVPEKATTCPCCKNCNCTSPFVAYHNLPETLFPVDGAVKNTVIRRSLHLRHCSICNHIFQDCIDAEGLSRIYGELYRYYPFQTLESFQEPYRIPFFHMFDLIFPLPVKRMRLLEIGCSSRTSMKPFSERGFSCTGVSPTLTLDDHEEDDSIELIESAYEEVDLKNPYDVIVLRFVLEHVVDLDLFLEKLHHDLKPGGHLFIQVPNIMNFIHSGNLCIGAHEHIHYFSKDSLLAFSRSASLETHILWGSDSPSLIGCFSLRKQEADQKPLSDFQHSLDISSLDLKRIMKNHKKICFYGAGLQLAWVLYVSGIDLSDKEVLIVDDNPVVQGRYMPHTGKSIVPFMPEILKTMDLIVLSLNPIYYASVIRKIRDSGISDIPIAIFHTGCWKVI